MEINQEKFHSIKGNSIGDHKRLFNEFLRELEPEEIKEFLYNLAPKNRQEKNFQIILMRKYGTNEDLKAVLMQGDTISNKIVLKLANINKLFEENSGNDFVENVCPKLSYVTRICLINKLSETITDYCRGEEYFAAIRGKYGLKIASPLLVACEENFVKDIISTNSIYLTDRQLIKLHKYKGFIQLYFKEKSKYEENCFFLRHKLARHLAINDVETFWELLQYGQPWIGKSGREELIKKYKNELIEKPEKYKTYLKAKFAMKHLTREEYRKLFRNIFPKSVDDIYMVLYNNLDNYIKSLPKKDRFSTLNDSFKELYGYDININEVGINKNMFSIEDQIKLTPDFDSYDVDLILKNVSLATDRKTRIELLVKLVQTCKLREDNEGLLKALRYFLSRHKNENIEVRRRFLEEIMREFPLNKLGDEYWDIFKQLLKVFEVNSECFYDKIEYMNNLMQKNIEAGLDFTDALEQCYKVKGLYDSLDFISDPKMEKLVLIKMPEILDKYTDDRQLRLSSFITKLIEFNGKHPKYFISYYKFPKELKEFIGHTDSVGATYNYYTVMNIMKMLKYIPEDTNEKNTRDEILDTLLQEYPNIYQSEIMKWFLSHRVDLAEKHLDLIFKDKRLDHGFIYEISKMHYHPINGKFKKLALDALASDDIKQICLALECLSFYDDYLNLIDKYKPTDPNINIDDENIKDLLSMQKAILKSLTNRPKPAESLDFVLPFCNRDYLRAAHGAIYHTFYHTPEKDLEAPLSELFTRSVSIRKQTIFLATTLRDLNYTKETLTDLTLNEKNQSLQQFILRRTFEFLCQENCAIFWQLLKTQINKVEINDHQSLWALMEFRRMPQKYLEEHIPLIWELARKFEAQREVHMLSLITPEMLELCPKIGEKIIEDTIFTSSWNAFVCKYLFANTKTLPERYAYIFNCMANETENNIKSAQNKIYNLFADICKQLIEEKITDPSAHLKMLSENLQSFNAIPNKLQYELLLAIFEAFLTSTADKNQFVAEYVTRQQIELTQKYGLEILKLHLNVVTKFMEIVYSVKMEDNFKSIVDIIERIFLIDASDCSLLLILSLMPMKTTRDEALLRRRDEVIAKLQDSPSNLVQIYLTDYFINLE